MSGSATLSGYWTGAYAYPDTPGAVPFNAHLEQDGTIVGGTITEPDTLGVFQVVIALSVLAGQRVGSQLAFRKTMQNGHPGHVILYEGAINADETRIDGRWTIPGSMSGGFSMERDKTSDLLAVERDETVEA